jgi:hypothetical protein
MQFGTKIHHLRTISVSYQDHGLAKSISAIKITENHFSDAKSMKKPISL